VRRTRVKKRLLDLAIVAMLFLAAYFAIFGGEYTVFQVRQLEALEAESAAELARTEAEIDSLSQVAARLRDDPEAIERVARERYGMIRNGEILYRFREGAPRAGGAIDGRREGE
jgi:cell division protein FtsB